MIWIRKLLGLLPCLNCWHRRDDHMSGLCYWPYFEYGNANVPCGCERLRPA